MFEVILLWLSLGFSQDCYLKFVPDAGYDQYFVNVDSIWASRDSVLEFYRSHSDTPSNIPTMDKLVRIGDLVYSSAFWSTVYREKGVSNSIFSVEYSSFYGDIYEAYFLFKSGEKYWLAMWMNVIELKGREARYWQIGDPIYITYKSIERDSVLDFLRSIDSAYKPLEISTIQYSEPYVSETGYAWVSLALCNRQNTYLIMRSVQLNYDSFSDLYHYHAALRNAVPQRK